jgi:hypothetical protein
MGFACSIFPPVPSRFFCTSLDLVTVAHNNFNVGRVVIRINIQMVPYLFECLDPNPDLMQFGLLSSTIFFQWIF